MKRTVLAILIIVLMTPVFVLTEEDDFFFGNPEDNVSAEVQEESDPEFAENEDEQRAADNTPSTPYLACTPEELFSCMDTNEASRIGPATFVSEGEIGAYVTHNMLTRLRYYVYTDITGTDVKSVALFKDQTNSDATNQYFVLNAYNAINEVLGNGNSMSEDDFLYLLDEINLDNPMQFENLGFSLLPADDGFALVIYPLGTDLDVANLPLRFSASSFHRSVPEETITSAQSCLKSYDFKGLKKLLEESEPSSFTQQLLGVIESTGVFDLVSECTVENDSVSGDSRVFYKNLDGISNDTHIYARIEDSLTVRVGFTSKNWLFFDKYEIYVDQEEVAWGYLDFLDIVRDTTRSGVIEYYDTILRDEEVEAVVNSKKATIRFISEDGEKHLDKEISKKEKEGLRTIYALSEAYGEISNALYAQSSLEVFIKTD